jgi:DNA topoisomerase I
MKLCINGQEQIVDEVASLKQLLQTLKINSNSVVIEHNRMVVPRQRLEEQPIHEGDEIEIVHFVGGGSEDEEAAPVKSKKVAIEGSENGDKVPKKPKKKSTRASSYKGPKNLVIVESPAKAKTINKFLGNDYQVEASYGHVRDLPKSKMGIDPTQGFDPHYVIIAKARKTVTHLKKQAKGKTGIFLAPDPDREGEAISWHLAHIFTEENGGAELHRVVFNEITKAAVQEAFRHPREIRMNLVNAQQARRILDRIVGYELSPLLWKKVGRGLSAGRVQSVALRLIVDREREIRKFIPEEYWSLEAKLASEKPQNAGKIFISKLEKIAEEKADLKNAEQTEKIRAEIENAEFKVHKIEKKERSRRPQAPFTTSKLQQEAYNRLGYPAAKTMRVAQRLYEGVELGEEGHVGLITYMRTDSVNISPVAQKEAVDYIHQKYGKDYLPEKPPIYRSKKGAQEAHEAIRPSSVLREPKTIRQYLPDDEYKLYDLIWRKFVASQMTPALDEHMAISIVAGEKYFFKSTGRRNLFPGFGIIFTDLAPSKEVKEKKEGETEEEDEGISESNYDLPELAEGEILKLHELLGHQHFTKPPARFNDASLVKMLEEQGIGRPSTYAPIIYTLVVRDYVSRKGGALMPTELGETVVDLLVLHFPKVLDVHFTANMESELDKIEDGEVDWVSVIKNFYLPFEADVAVAREEMKNVKQEAVPTEYNCTVCGKMMMIKWGRFGKFLACSGFPECKSTRSIPTGFKCPEPNCGGDLIKRMSKRRQVFYGCSNYPKCNHITNKLPKQEGANEDDKGSDTEHDA